MTPTSTEAVQNPVLDMNSARLLSHDLKSPIAVFEMLQANIAFGREEHQTLYRLALERLYELTGRLTHRSNGATYLGLTETLSDTARLVSSDNQNVGAYIDVQVDAKVQLPCRYLTQLNRVVTNLIQNAIEAYPLATLPKPVSLKASVSGKHLLIEVCDQGTGMDDLSKQRALLGGFTTKVSGNGLGLSSAKRWCEEAGGHFSVKSLSQKGTTVSMKLPIPLS